MLQASKFLDLIFFENLAWKRGIWSSKFLITKRQGNHSLQYSLYSGFQVRGANLAIPRRGCKTGANLDSGTAVARFYLLLYDHPIGEWTGGEGALPVLRIKVVVIGFLSRHDEDLLDVCPP
jgi:hypothetical protein